MNWNVIRVVALVFGVATLIAASATAEGILGASFGYTYSTYPDAPKVHNNVVALPGAEDWRQPGLRAGYQDPGGYWDVIADIGLVHRSGTIGSHETAFELIPQIQVNPLMRDGLSPLINAGIGLDYETFSLGDRSVNLTRPAFGGGVGLRKSMSDGHGFIREEVRYDYLPKSWKTLSPTLQVGLLATHMLSLKLGFDLVVIP